VGKRNLNSFCIYKGQNNESECNFFFKTEEFEIASFFWGHLANISGKTSESMIGAKLTENFLK